MAGWGWKGESGGERSMQAGHPRRVGSGRSRPRRVPPLGTRPVPAASLSPPACEAQARPGVPQAPPQGAVPLETALSREQCQDTDAAGCLPPQGATPGPPFSVSFSREQEKRRDVWM